MTQSRDEFPIDIKRKLAQRAGLKCSNPDCGAQTNGPDDTQNGSVNIGVACHICAAAAGGPRYDDLQTPEKRKSIENGIWCCANCARLIDSSTSTYTEQLLLQWKKEHEDKIRLGIGKTPDCKISEVSGEHTATGIGEITALHIEGSTIIKPGTKSTAFGFGKVTGTKIGRG